MTQLVFGQFEVRDMRHKEKFEIDDWYLNGYAKKCGIYATGVYLSLCRHVDKDQECWPSLKKIAEELNISIPMVQRGIKILEKYHIILKERMGKKLNNRYVLLDKSEWSGVSFTMKQGFNHSCNHRPLHSKESQLRNTHIKEKMKKIFIPGYGSVLEENN